MRRLTALLFLLLAAPAQAAEISASVSPAGGRQLGSGDHRVSGALSEGGAALANQVVTLEARRFPFEGEFTALQTATTGSRGQFVFFQELDRNHELRVSSATATSGVLDAYVFPRFVKLSFKQLKDNRVRISQRYATPDDVVLEEPTFFYLGRRSAKTAVLRAKSTTRQIGAGRFIATAVVKVPRAYEGKFRYASCIPGDMEAGMGNPAENCGQRHRF